MATQFSKLAEQVGTPIGIVIDGATELHEGAKCFADSGKEVVIVDDIKHKAANILKKVIGKSERFCEFESHLGKTTAGIQHGAQHENLRFVLVLTKPSLSSRSRREIRRSEI